MQKELNQDVKRFFWDINPDVLEPQKDKEYIIVRILEYGDTEALKWLFSVYDKKTIKNVLMNRRGFSKKTANFWSKILDVDKNKIQCLKKSYREIQKTHWPY